MASLLEDALRTGESHSIEFKKSIGELREAAQTVVAFANAHGGDLFFGVTNNRDVPGLEIGNTTLENLAAALDRYIYPYSPAAIDPLQHWNGKAVIRLSVVPDTPPVVGVYLYSSQQLDPTARVLTDHLRAYRRVGRTNRQVPDFMWLRPELRSDPVVLLSFRVPMLEAGKVRRFGGRIWRTQGSGPAFAVTLRLTPELAQPLNVRDLWTDDPEHFTFELPETDIVPDPLRVSVGYTDAWGCRWELWMDGSFVSGEEGDRFELAPNVRQRIVELPPQHGTG